MAKFMSEEVKPTILSNMWKLRIKEGTLNETKNLQVYMAAVTSI